MNEQFNKIEERARFDFIRYSNCWEDTEILCTALKAGPGKRILSIASALDNALAIAATGAEVVAVDLNPAQIACGELKCAAIRSLPYRQVLSFLGVTDDWNRLSTYKSLASQLSPDSQSFWNANTKELELGFIHAGKFEKYFQLFRKRILPLIVGTSKINSLLEKRSYDQQKAFYSQQWDTWRWRWLFKIFFGRRVMGWLGRDPEFFRYVEGSVGDRILERAKLGLTETSTYSNSYLRYIMKGNFTSEALPLYLQEHNFEAVRAGIDRITLNLGAIDEVATSYGPKSFDGFNLSDIFEYLNEDLSCKIYGKLIDSARVGARLVYWNMLVPRSCPAKFQERVQICQDLARDLFAQDKAFFYSAFKVEELS